MSNTSRRDGVRRCHCVAGDGVGILAGAVLARVFGLTGLPEVALEYALGFAFGWLVFQALFMRDMVGGSYIRSLAKTFIPELLSMNLLMTGMVPTAAILKTAIGRGADPTTAAFWFVMSMALLVGAIVAYPINWWLVRYHLKHGMMTVRPADASPVAVVPGHGGHAGMDHAEVISAMDMSSEESPRPAVPVMAALSFLALAAGLLVSTVAGPM
jgi:Domain of unknown function (DUF4396)